MPSNISVDELFRIILAHREKILAIAEWSGEVGGSIPRPPYRYDYSDPIIRDGRFVPSPCPLERANDFYFKVGWSDTRQEMFEDCLGKDVLESERLRELISQYGTHWKSAHVAVPSDLGVRNLNPVAFLETYVPGVTLRLHELGKDREFTRMRSAEGDAQISIGISFDEDGGVSVEMPTQVPSVFERGYPVYEGDELLEKFAKPIRSEYRATVIAERGMCEYVSRLGLTEHFTQEICVLCGNEYWPQALHSSNIRRAGLSRYCVDCHALRSDVWRKIPLDDAERRELALRGIELAAELTEMFPFKNLKRQIIGHLSPEERDRWFRAQIFMPDRSASDLFGGWDEMLALSDSIGVRPRKGRGGYVSTSACGHVCYSLGERTICDFLDRHQIAHSKEPVYPTHTELNPTGKLRADWLIDDLWVELAGYPDDSFYMKKMAAKQDLAISLGLRHLVVMPSDLVQLELIFGVGKSAAE